MAFFRKIATCKPPYSRAETEIIMKITGMTRDDILKLTDCMVTTLGEKGSLISADGYDEHVPSVPVERVVDPTGAGDAYRAGLLKGIADGKDLHIAARMGAVAAAYAVEKYGTQEHRFLYDDFLKRYKNNFGEL